MDPDKKRYRVKYIFGERYVKRVPRPPMPVIRSKRIEQPKTVDPSTMPKGMSMETLDRIILNRCYQTGLPIRRR
jgi:hypothetical protein